MERLHQAINEAVSEGTQLQVAFGLERAENHFRNLLREIHLAEIATRNERGLVFRMQNNYTRAEDDFSEALTLARDIGDVDGEAMSLGGLIDLARTGDRDPDYKRGKDLTAAEAWKYEARLAMTEMPENPPRLSRIATLIQFGLLEHEMAQDPQALESYSLAERECRELIIQNPDDSKAINRLMRVLTVKGVVHMALGQLDEAYACQKESFAGSAAQGEIRGQGNAIISLAQLAEKTNQTEEATAWYQKAREIKWLEDGKIKIDDAIQQMAIEGLERLASK